MAARICGWCGDDLGFGINHTLCAQPLQDIADRLDERAESVSERADDARVQSRILRVVA